jgi:Resolvase, N terminal domain
MTDLDCVLFVIKQSSDGLSRQSVMESLITSDKANYQRPWPIICRDRKELLLDRKKAVEASAHWKVPLISPMLQYLARSSADFHGLYEELNQRGVPLRVLRFGRKSLDSRNMGNLVLSDFTLAYAEFESDLARERTFNASLAAKNSDKTGKPPIADEIREAIQKEHASGRYSADQIAERHGIGRSTVFKIVKESKRD